LNSIRIRKNPCQSPGTPSTGERVREEGEGVPGWRKQPSVELVGRRERGVVSGER